MRVAILSSIAWRSPPWRYGPWEQVASNVAEGLIDQGIQVTLFATGDSVTRGKLEWTAAEGYAENPNLDAKVWECLHISALMEKADDFDLIHNHFDFLPLSYSKLIRTPIITTIHGFSSPKIIPVFKKYNENTHYVSISDADRSAQLSYLGTVYNGVDQTMFTFNEHPDDCLLYFGRIHPHKGTHEAIQIAQRANKKLIISGLIQDEAYFKEKVKPYIDDASTVFVGNSGPKERDQLLGSCRALLHPISFDEPFGLSVVEAMMCGTPVIAFNRGSMPELIQDSKTGFLVNTIDEAVAAVEKIPRIDRSDCHHHAIAHFTKEKMVTEYIKLYQRILG